MYRNFKIMLCSITKEFLQNRIDDEVFGILLSLITIALMYIQLIDQKSEIFVRLLLYQSKIPIPLWLILLSSQRFPLFFIAMVKKK